MRTVIGRNVLLPLALVLGPSCSFIYSTELDSKQCTSDSDCEAASMKLETPLVCREHACQAPVCGDGTECPTGSMCADGLCVAEASDAGGTDAGPERVACTQDSECNEGEERCGLDGFCYEKWGCLDDDPDWPTADESFSFQAGVQGIESPDPSLVGEITVEACSASDPTCDSPVVTNDEVMVSDAKIVTVPFSKVPSSGFVGVIRVASAVMDPSGDNILPNYLHFTPENPLVGSFVAPRPVLLVPESRLQFLTSFAGITPNPEAAGMFVNVYDCGGQPASGVSMAPKSSTEAIFIPLQGEHGLLLGSDRTTEDGTAIFVNLPANRSLVFVLRDEDSDRVLSDTFNLVTRGAAVNYVMYFPRYSAVEQWLAESERQGNPAP